MSGEDRGLRGDGPRQACPICRRPAVTAFRPFCSQRCADVDLGRWLNERYAIPDDTDTDAGPREPDPEA